MSDGVVLAQDKINLGTVFCSQVMQANRFSQDILLEVSDCMRLITLHLLSVILLCSATILLAEEFYLESPYNNPTMRFEIENDIIWSEDSNFSDGWSLQYHSTRYADWDETQQPGFIKWVGNHFPTLDDDNSIVRNTHSVGQNIITPGDIQAEIPSEGDLPYAGTLTYTLNWQRFNRKTARNFQISLGILGKEALGEPFQAFAHDDLGLGEDPKGWNTQRKTEPILNLGYQYSLRLAQFGQPTNGWGGLFELTPSVSLGNLFTAAEVGLGFRYGWNRMEGFSSVPSPPGRGIFQAALVPKPAYASPHSIEILLGIRGVGLIYTVIYDGSIVTSDDRDVERENLIATGLIGFNYHYHKLLSVRLHIEASTDFLREEGLPPPTSPNGERTATDNSYGAVIIDFYF